MNKKYDIFDANYDIYDIILIDADRDFIIFRSNCGIIFKKAPISGEKLYFRTECGDWNSGIVKYTKHSTSNNIVKIYLEHIQEVETNE